MDAQGGLCADVGTTAEAPAVPDAPTWCRLRRGCAFGRASQVVIHCASAILYLYMNWLTTLRDRMLRIGVRWLTAGALAVAVMVGLVGGVVTPASAASHEPLNPSKVEKGSLSFCNGGVDFQLIVRMVTPLQGSLDSPFRPGRCPTIVKSSPLDTDQLLRFYVRKVDKSGNASGIEKYVTRASVNLKRNGIGFSIAGTYDNPVYGFY